MGQGEVLDVLRKRGKPMSRREIAEALDCCPIQVSHIINRLKKFGEVGEKNLDRKEAYNYHKEIKVHHRMKLYYIIE